MRLTVYPPGGRVVIHAPAGTLFSSIEDFTRSKINWIIKHRERFLNNSKSTGVLKNNAGVYIWGKSHVLELIERRGHPKIIVTDSTIKIYVRPLSSKDKVEELLDKWYRRVLKETAPEIIKKWEKIIGIEVSKLYVRKMKTHWGSCNYNTRSLRLNSELVKRDPLCLEYVIVHEMLHIIEKSHNRNFYRLIGKYFPDWKAIRKKMNSGEI